MSERKTPWGPESDLHPMNWMSLAPSAKAIWRALACASLPLNSMEAGLDSCLMQFCCPWDLKQNQKQFYFEVIVDSQKFSKNNTEVLSTPSKFPPEISSYIHTVRHPNREANISLVHTQLCVILSHPAWCSPATLNSASPSSVLSPKCHIGNVI